MSDLKAQIEISADASGVESGVSKAKKSLADLGAAASREGKKASDPMKGIGDEGEKSSKKVDAATRSMIQSIQRTAAVMEAGSKTSSKYYETLAAQRGVDVNTLKPYLAQLDAITAKQKLAEQALSATSPAMKRVEISAAQTAAAMRGVPAQFTDIVTALQGGQQPLTVFIQQGGQLRDMFGGAGPAARALGGYIASLANPFTIAAVAAGGLAFAYNQGSKEADAYRKALILTGNAAGATANQLGDMAARVSKSVGTQGQAAAALAEMAGTGRIAAGNLEYFTRVAVQMEKTVSKSAAETAKDLAELGKSPLSASEKLNEQYHYLTSSVYAQIKALQDQGKTEDAAAVAQKAYADAFDKRSKEVVANLGSIERGWKGVVDWAKKGWDSILNVGRQETNVDQSSALSAQIEASRARIEKLKLLGNGKDNKLAIASEEARVASLTQAQAILQENVRLERRMGEAAAATVQQNEARIAWDKEGDKYLSRRALMEREINAEREKGLAAGVSATAIEQRIGDIRKKYSDIFNDGIESQIEAIQRRGQVEDEILKRSIAQLQVKRQIGASNEEDFIKDVAKSELDAFARRKTSLEQELALTRGKQNSLKEQSALSGQIAVLNEQRLTREKQLENDLLVLDVKRNREAANQYADLVERASGEAQSFKDRVLAQEDYNEAIGLSKYGVEQLEAARLHGLAAMKDERADLAELTDMSGELTQMYRDQANALRGLADKKIIGAQKGALVDVWRSIDETAHDTFVHIFDNGKSAFDRLRDTLKSGLYDLLYQMTVRKWIFSVGATATGIPGLAGASDTPNFMQGASMFSAGKTLWEGFNTGSSGFGDTIAASIQRGVNFFDSSGAQTAMQYGPVQNSAFAQGVGNVAPYLASIAIGKAISSAISNGYQVNHGNALNNIGALGGVIGSTITGAINRAFGTKLAGSGVMGSISGDQFSGNSYEFKKGGLFRGDKTVTSALDPQVNTVFADAIKAMSANFSALGATIGAGGDLLKDFSYEFRLALADFDDAGKQKEIQRALSTMSDSMAQAFVDSFRTSIDTAKQAASRYFTNTSDGARTFTGGVVDQAATSSPLDPYIADIIRIFDKQKESLAGVAESEGKLASFTTALFGLGDGLVENSGYLRQFGEALDFKKLEAAATGAETVVDTFARLNTVFAATSSVAEILGKNVDTAFGALGLASTAARERLITLAGGIDSLASGMQFFSQNFLTESERLAPTQKAVAAEMERLGKAGITTHEQFANLVKGLDLAREADARLYADLLKIAPAFDLVADAAKAAAEVAAEAAKEARRAAEENAMKAVDAAFSGLQRSVDVERKSVQSVFDAAMVSLHAGLDGVNSRISKLTGLSGALKSTIDRMTASADSAGEREAAKAQIRTAIALARTGGVFPEAASLSRSLDIVSQISESSFASFTDFKREQLLAKSSLQELAGLTDDQLSIEEQTLKSIEDQIKVTEDGYKAQISYLDGILESAQMQIDALNGIDTSIKSLADAIAAFNRPSTGAGGGVIGGSAGGSVANTYFDERGNSPFSFDLPTNADLVRDWYKAAGQPADAEGVAYWTRELSRTDVSQRDVKGTFAAIVEELTGKKLASFDVGTNWVPSNMTAKIHEGERIIPKADNTAIISALRDRGADNAAVVNALARVEKLLSDISAETRAGAQHGSKLAKTLDRLSPDGNSLAVKVEA